MSRWPHASFQLPLFKVRIAQQEKERYDTADQEVPATTIGVEKGLGEAGSVEGSGEGDLNSGYAAKASPLDNYYKHINKLVQNALKNGSDEMNMEEEAKRMMEEARQMLLTSDLMQRNFIKIKVVRPSHDVMYVEEVPELGISSFLSGIGGAMNFWMGITLIVVMELVELIFDLFDLLFGNNKSKKRRAHENCDNNEDKNSTEAVRV
jgi:hypothetical protein